MNTYRIRYTRYDPVYGPNWTILYYKQITATRTVKAKDKDAAIDKLTRIVTKDRPGSRVEVCWWSVLA